jgi:hypothetical protein
MMKLLSFQEAISEKYYNQSIRLSCLVMGKHVIPFSVPKILRIKCDAKGECENCRYKKEVDLEVPMGDERLLLFIDTPDMRLTGIIKKIFGIECQKFVWEKIRVQNIERLYICEPLGVERSRKGSENRLAYYVGYGIDINTHYEMVGYTTTNPVDQSLTHVFTEATKTKSDIQSFVVTKQLANQLNEFRVEHNTVDEIWSMLEELYESYAFHITKIFNRFDLHLAVDLVFRSVINFYLDGNLIKRGWADVMLIGDTQCGKGYVATGLSQYFNVGEVISGENVSFAGLVAGLQQFQDRQYVVTIGKLPLNDYGLLIIDEAEKLLNDFPKLSRIRSEGIVEVTKIQTLVTNARTRIMWLTNPPSKMIAAYSYGIESVGEIVKAPEDIARFDYCLVVSHDEVEMGDINRTQGKKPSYYTRELEQQLVLWLWSRRADQVVFSDDAVKAIYRFALEFSSEYSFNIPLIQGENFRIKLAKVAIGFAGRFFNASKDGQILQVEKVHVDCAAVFFKLIYSKSASGYYQYSQMHKPVSDNVDEVFRRATAFIKTWGERQEICRCLLMNNKITINDLVEHLRLYDKSRAVEIISYLLQDGCIVKRGPGFYIKSPQFTEWLKQKLFSKGSDL